MARNDGESGRAPTLRVELGPLASNLPFLSRVMRAYIRVENAEVYRHLDFQPGEIVLLNLIAINPGVSQQQLADAVVIKKSAVTMILKGLEQRGLVERRKVSSDRRYNALALTANGLSAVDRLRVEMDLQHAALTACFSDAERQDLFAKLNRLNDHLLARHLARGDAEHSAADD
jgi:DNA-binding MarR family transcriptional regulator